MAKIVKIQQVRKFIEESSPIQSITPERVAAGAAPVVLELFPSLPFAIGDILTESEVEAFEERSAIMEYEAHKERHIAEPAALEDVCRARDPAPALLAEFGCIEIKGELYDQLPKFSDRDDNGIKRIPGDISKNYIREAVPPWDRLPRTGNAGW